MNFIQKSLIICLIILNYQIFQIHALECRACDETNPSCLFAHQVESRTCNNDDDVCYSWLYRSGGDMGVRRDCLSTKSPEYTLVKYMLGERDSECVKRVRGLDCFTLCTTDLCN